MKDIIKARINELQVDINRIKTDLKAIQDSARGNFGVAEIEKVDLLTKELIAYKSATAELINLLN
jgi:hypothetical protein